MSIKSFYFIAIVLFSSLSISAQKKDSTKVSNISIGLDLMSRYIWRGSILGSTPSFQPNIEYTKGNISIGVWGAYGLDNSENKEIDLYIKYSLSNNIAISFTDYFFTSDISSYKYFDLKSETTGHIFEFSFEFSGSNSFPISIFLATNLYGNDVAKNNKNGIRDGIQHSSYIEFGYEKNYFKIFTGFNLTAPDEKRQEIGFYGDNYGIVNLGVKFTKDILITNTFSIPFQVSFITNPLAQKVYLVAGITLK